jgi:hypothetical protein
MQGRTAGINWERYDVLRALIATSKDEELKTLVSDLRSSDPDIREATMIEAFNKLGIRS